MTMETRGSCPARPPPPSRPPPIAPGGRWAGSRPATSLRSGGRASSGLVRAGIAVLQLVEFGEEAAPGEELLERPLLLDAPVLQHDVTVGQLDRRDAVGDVDGCAHV